MWKIPAFYVGYRVFVLASVVVEKSPGLLYLR
jgi:hypothetical protein